MATTKRKPKPEARKGRSRKKDWKGPFVELLRDYGDVNATAKTCGVAVSTVYDHRKKDEKFRAEWDSALDALYDSVDAEFLRRGREGVIEAVYHKGVIVGEVRKYDTTALLGYANAHMKGRGYGREVKITGDPDAPLQITTIITDRERPTMADQKALEKGKGK